MKKIFLNILIIFLLLAIPVSATKEKNLDSRKSDFSFNEKIDHINNLIKLQNKKWIAGETSMSHLSTLEIKALLSKTRLPKSKNTKLLKTPALTYAPSLDWRNNNGDWLTPIKAQLGCGSCWAFSTISVIESRINIALNNPDYNIDLSEQDLVSCSGAGDCINGGEEQPALEYIKTTGTVKESCFPYTATDESCANKCPNYPNELVKVLDYNLIPFTISDIKQAINDYGPVTVYMEVYDDFPTYIGGIYDTLYFADNSHWLGYHGISIIGYNDIDPNPYWIIKNSWDTGWGENGYGRISYNAQTFNFDPEVFTDGYFFLDNSYVVTTTDIDNDGVADSADNCPEISNSDQLDTDNDLIGDACDEDDDNDAVLDLEDNCPLIPNPLQEDIDSDGIGDACDSFNDNDNDGVENPVDNCPNIPNPDQSDIDGDSIGDVCDYEIIINEIMYNPVTDLNHEWIEIYNPGTAMDLTGWKFYEADTNHGLSLIRGSFILENNQYAVIADDAATFLLDYPDFTGALFDSSFSLSNTGEELSLKNSIGEIVHSVLYSDAAPEGFSLELYTEGWYQSFSIGGTPGIINNNCPPVITNFQVNPIVSISKNNPMTISADVSDKDLNSVAIVLVDSNNLISDNQTLFIVSVDDSGVSGPYSLDDWPALYFNIANDIVSEPVTIFVPETPPNELFVFGSFQKNPEESMQSDCMLFFNIDDYTLLGGNCQASGDIQIENSISEFTISSMKFVDGLFSEPSEIDGTTFTLYDIGNILNPQLEETLVPSGNYSVMMHIEDKAGNFADDERSVTVDNDPPVVSIISPLDLTIFDEGELILFNGTAIDIEDGDLSASLNWSTIDENIGTGASFEKILPIGKHDINARVIDNAGWSTKDKHIIYVNTPGNTPPIADAGDDINVYVNNLVTLDASASSDPENDTLTYTWIQKEGPFTVSIESEIVNPTFTPSETGTYEFELTVNDGILDSSDTVIITVSSPPPPPPSSSGGSGGGGTKISGEEIIISTASQTITLKKDTRIVYSLNNQGHYINLDNIYDDHVTVTVHSDPLNVDLYPGKNTKVDSDGNGIDDLLMRLENIFSASARVTFKVMKEVAEEAISETKEEGMEKSAGLTEVTGAVAGEGSSSGLFKALILIGSLIVFISGYTLLHIKKPHLTYRIHRIPRRVFRKFRRRGLE